MAGSNRGRKAIFGTAAVALFALSGAACTVAISPSPEATPPSATAPAASAPVSETSPSASIVATTPSPAALWTFDLRTPATAALPTESPAPFDAPFTAPPRPTGSPTPPLPTGPLPSLSPIPAGMWTGINWIAIPGGHSPAVPPVNDYEWHAFAPQGNSDLEGWSMGYVEFIWDPHARTLIPWASADGLNWNAGANLVNTSKWEAYFKEYDAEIVADDWDPRFHDACAFWVDNFQEGPATLLMAGRVDCFDGGKCGHAFDSRTTFDTTWTSQDGLTWTPLTIPDSIDGGLISGGSSGFVALGSDGLKATIWTSQDGRTWMKGALPPAALAAGSSVGNPISFTGGFVLPGEVEVKKGTLEDGCPGTDSNQYQGALWWSPDGETWTRDSLTGANSTNYYDAMMRVVRIDDHTVVAKQYGSATEWASSDGKTWTRLQGSPVAFASFGPASNVVVGRDRGLVWDGGPCVFDETLTLVTLKQTGDLPWKGSQYRLGPTGLLATSDGARFWIGVPAAG